MGTTTSDDGVHASPSPGNARTRLDSHAATARMATVHAGWMIDAEATSITRRFTFDTFAAAVQLANLAAWLGEKANHHPDVAFGWGYCAITFRSHDVGGLSDRDFACAARLDALVA